MGRRPLGLVGGGGLSPEYALAYIAVEGTAEIRVKPRAIRVVMAVMTEGKTAEACQAANARQVAAVREQWRELGIPDEKVVEDFIAVLPRFAWRMEKSEDDTKLLTQRLAGYRMQTNLHVAVNTEAEAMAAIHRAFSQGVSDIITFDYWSPELDEKKREARQAALDAAKKKADVLLAVFDERPPVINIKERTQAFFPKALYQTFENVLEETVEYRGSWSNFPRIKAYRPKMTFYHGLNSNADIRPKEPPMKPEISVVSTVSIYYQSPATKSPGSKSQ
jgi:uncharacterized protein YggE